jgi:serine phosphatase RsbU (regulator of sigma subunit)
MHCAPTVPLGFGKITGTVGDPPVATEKLEPGDGVLFYTYGLVEAHLPGQEQFGLDRLVDLTMRLIKRNPRRSCAVSYALFSIIRATNSPMTPRSSCSDGRGKFAVRGSPPM